MKKLIIVLIAMIGFGFAAKAQRAQICEDPQVTTNSITVKVCVYLNDALSADKTYTVKVTPSKNDILQAVVDGAKYVNVTVKKGQLSGSGETTFTCDQEDGGKLNYCRKFDFDAQIYN